jgi:hypothetical protein
MRGQQSPDLAEHPQRTSGRRRLSADSGTEFAQEQEGRDLASIVGGLPVPGAGSIGAAEGALHRGAQDGRIDAMAALEIGKKKMRGRDDGSGSIGSGSKWKPQRGRREG